MEDRAHYVLIGAFTFAVIAGAFGFLFWLHNTVGKKESVFYRVIFDGAVSGLGVGNPVVFNGIRVGEVTDLQLNPDKPSQVTAMLTVHKATPIRSDTRVGLEFTGLTGIASVSLKGISATTPLLEKEEGEPPTLKADASASQDVGQAVREVVTRATAAIDEDRAALHQAMQNLAVFTTALARNADQVDEIVSNSKEATASFRELAENLDRRTADIAAGISKFTAAATKQIEIVGADTHRAVGNIDKAVTDLAQNPQRILFGGGGSKPTPPKSPEGVGPPTRTRRQSKPPTPE
jgi:phospholipid/cholesterol/gamma-HCH transport system substrate-binding protein